MDRCFNPRRPHGRRPPARLPLAETLKFQSAPPSRAATTGSNDSKQAMAGSIRAALTGGDPCASTTPSCASGFNPRRPHGRRPSKTYHGMNTLMFQSAPPSRAATMAQVCSMPGVKFQSAPPSRAATRVRGDTRATASRFNPRRPHGRRPGWSSNTARPSTFQSAPPSRAATLMERLCKGERLVSIRAALTGGDRRFGRIERDRSRFNPRRPHGRRQLELFADPHAKLFQSAPPSRAATGGRKRQRQPARVSIRAALTGGDEKKARMRPPTHRFNPRRPHGRRRMLING